MVSAPMEIAIEKLRLLSLFLMDLFNFLCSCIICKCSKNETGRSFSFEKLSSRHCSNFYWCLISCLQYLTQCSLLYHSAHKCQKVPFIFLAFLQLRYSITLYLRMEIDSASHTVRLQDSYQIGQHNPEIIVQKYLSPGFTNSWAIILCNICIWCWDASKQKDARDLLPQVKKQWFIQCNQITWLKPAQTSRA